jgi:hypothetical protein
MSSKAALVASLLMIAPALGCSTTTRTETRTTTSSAAPADDHAVVREHTTTTTTDDDSCHGVLSCTVDFAGDVIAFPFRLIGAVFGAIF